MLAKSNTGGYLEQDKDKNSKKKTPRAKAGFGGRVGGGQKWCSVHKSTTHDDVDCYQQGAPRPQKGSAFTTTMFSAHTFLADDDEKPVFNFNDNFDDGFL